MVRRISRSERKYKAPSNWKHVINTAGSIRHNASVMVCTSSSRRFNISPVCSCSLPDQQLSIKCTKSLRCNSFRNAISMRLVRQLRAADNTSCSTRQPTIHPIYMARLSPDTPVAISIKCLQTNTKNKEAPTCNIPVKAYTIIGIRKPQEISQSHFIHFPILIQTKILSFFHFPFPSHPPSAHEQQITAHRKQLTPKCRHTQLRRRSKVYHTAVAYNFHHYSCHIFPAAAFRRMKVSVPHQDNLLPLHPIHPMQHIAVARQISQHHTSHGKPFRLLQHNAVTFSHNKRTHTVSFGPQRHRIPVLKHPAYLRKKRLVIEP